MMVFENLTDAFMCAAEIAVIKDGEYNAYAADSGEFRQISAMWQSAISQGRQMPAFGVSLDDMTTKEMQRGVWLEFCFDGNCTCDGMPFEKLAVNIRAEYGGFNVIRYNVDDGYAGRCYYIDLCGGDLREFYTEIIKY